MSLGHKTMLFAGKTIAGTALDLLTKPELLQGVKDEFKKRLAGRKYKSPIPDNVKPPHDVAKQAAEITRT
jgi:aminobenzoyl-glutamate utilization protein B